MPNGMAIFRREPPKGEVECRWGRHKTRFSTNRCIHCVYSVVNHTSREVWKIEPRRTASSRTLTAASVIHCSHKTTTKCLWRVRHYTPKTEVNPLPPDTTPLVITPFFAAVGHRRTEPGGYFLLQTDTNPYSWPYPTHEAGSWPQPTHERQKTRSYVCLSGEFWSDTAGDNRR